MSIPKILALDMKYQIQKSELEKTIKLNLNINKEKFAEINKKRLNNELIKLEDVNMLIQKGQVHCNNNKFNFIIEPSNDEETKLYKLIEPLLEIDIKYFKTNQTFFLHLAPEFNKLINKKDYNSITEKYYKEIQESLVERNISENNYKKLKEGKHKFSIIYRTLINKPLNQVKNIFLPALLEKENLFFNEKDELDKGYYKNLIYIPEDYIWNIPLDMSGKPVKVEKVEYSLRYLNLDEIDNNLFIKNIDNEEYFFNLGKIICEKICDLTSDNSFEINLSNDDIMETNAVVETNMLPSIKEKDNELYLTSPQNDPIYLLKLFFGINSKFFNEKIKVEKEHLLHD
tara:strand:+ start:154 stop:1182 length:1029 start_codon:yes stop_codon:yes gene_type:complete